ncbi:branched-chain amino acid transport system permease protein [Nocardioides terrae]|uniref:Branched-chain amino acid transport system permease protein n=1 Tax=Nocardioides terrae TaxID=574651 RepID=A0A1I1F351_9ACTN|nr:branched-chain amino acid ABC transporter permease [Nocardioides terrae]SFB93386.1 branched-chain amino acid transport system permease protein [Nocardioides terrae]
MDVSTTALAQTLLNGALLGCLYGCIALGLTIKWGHLGIADFFHISVVLLAAYITFTLVTEAGWHPFATLLVTAPACFVVGVASQWLFTRLDADDTTSLLLTFGLFIVAEGVASQLWSADLKSMRRDLPDGLREAIHLPAPLDRLAVTPPDLLSLVLAVVMVGLASWSLRFTRSGRAVQAMRQDQPIAEAFGVRAAPLALAVSGLAALSASVAGMAVAVKMPLQPQLPLHWIGVVVVACLLGGLGRPLGALVAAVVLMMLQNAWSLWFAPQWASAVTYGVLVLYLAAQPLSRVIRERLTHERPTRERPAVRSLA